jgi:hypothetical protein
MMSGTESEAPVLMVILPSQAAGRLMAAPAFFLAARSGRKAWPPGSGPSVLCQSPFKT